MAKLEDAAPEVRWAALATLSGLGQADVVPALLAALPRADPRMEVRLYFLLARQGDRRTWDTFVAGLQHPNTMVRQSCADGLVRTAHPGDEAVLGAALAKAAPAVALGLTEALTRLRTPAAADAVAQLLAKDDPALRQYGAQGLAELRTPEAVSRLIPHAHDADAGVRSWVYYGLGQYGDHRALPLLEAGATDADAYVRTESVWGLGRLGDARVLPLVRAGLDDPEPAVRRNAAQGLGMLDLPEALPDLQRAATDSDAAVRVLVAEARLRLGDENGAGELIHQLQNPNREFREIALRGLTLYTGQMFGTDYDAWNTWWTAERVGTTSPPPETP